MAPAAPPPPACAAGACWPAGAARYGGERFGPDSAACPPGASVRVGVRIRARARARSRSRSRPRPKI
eukprot:scaffold12433_cov129-Isochrysis_galbana.AAC.1